MEKRNLKKKAAAVAAVLLALITAFSGVFAWRDYRQHKTNQAGGLQPKYDVTLVENFAEDKDWKIQDGALTKEVSVLNNGDAEEGFEEVYVRIQLKEYMDFKPMETEITTDRYMIDTEGKFIFYACSAASSSNQTAAIAYFNGRSETSGAVTASDLTFLTDAAGKVTGYFLKTQIDDVNGVYGKHVYTKYDLGDMEWLVGDESLLNAYIEGNTPHSAHNARPNAECGYPVHEWAGTDLEEVLAQPGADLYIKWLLGDDVVLYSEWAATGAEAGPFWIIDDRANGNGYVYWGEALQPGDSTALFLEAIEMIEKPEGDFNYRLHVELDAISISEFFGKDPQWTDAPEEILKVLSGKEDEGWPIWEWTFEKLMMQIRQDYFEQNLQKYTPEYTVGDVTARPYGIYGSSVPVMMSHRGALYDMRLWKDVIAGVTINYTNGNRIFVWRNGKFYSLQEAYDRSFLTVEDLQKIAAIQNR